MAFILKMYLELKNLFDIFVLTTNREIIWLELKLRRTALEKT